MTKKAYKTLMKVGLIERQGKETLRLTSKGMELFFGEDVSVFVYSFKSKDIYEFIDNLSSF